MKFTVLATAGTQLKVVKKQLEKMKTELNKVRDNYHVLHKKNQNSMQGVTVVSHSYHFPSPSYIGGIGSELKVHRYYDNSTNKLLGETNEIPR